MPFIEYSMDITECRNAEETEGVGIVLDGVAPKVNEKQKKFLDIAKRNAENVPRRELDEALENDIVNEQMCPK